MYYLFFILGLLYAVEISSSLVRIAGYKLGTPETGMMLQSSMSLVSRALMFLFLPIVGFLADTNSIDISSMKTAVFIQIAPSLLVVINKSFFVNFFATIIVNMNSRGIISFKRNNSVTKKIKIKIKNKGMKYRDLIFYIFIGYIPLYLSYPLMLILLDIMPNYRATLLGSVSIINAMNAIIVTLILDPKLARIRSHMRLLENTYSNIIIVKLIVLFLSSSLLSLSLFIWL